MLVKKEKTILGVGILITFLSVLFSKDSALVIDSYGGSVGSIYSLILTIIYVLYATRLPIESQFVLIAIALPNTKALNIMGVSGAVCVCAVSSLVNYSKKSVSKAVLLLAFSFLIYSLQYYYRFSDFTLGVIRPVKTFMNLVFFSMMSRDVNVLKRTSEIGFKGAIGLFWGIVSAAVATVLKNGFSGRFSVVGNDPNILSIECATAMAIFSLAFFEYGSLKLPKYIVYFGVLGLVVLLSASRMGLILFAFVVLSSIFLNPKKLGRASVLLVLLVLGISVFLASDIGQNALDSFLTKHYSLVQKDDLSNGRLNFWTNYISVFNSSPGLWWIGMGDYRYFGIENQAHNFLLEDIANYGIIGLFTLYLAYFLVYRATYRNASFLAGVRNTRVFQLIPFLIPIIGGMTLHGLTNIIDTTLLFMGVLCMVHRKPQLMENNGVAF